MTKSIPAFPRAPASEAFSCGTAVSDPEWILRHVLSHGIDAELLEPPELRGRVAEVAEALAGGMS